MKEIHLTQGKVAIVDDEDFGLVSKYKWCFNTGYAARGVQLSRGIQGKQLMHRLIMGEPKGMEVDHADLNRLNCTRSNLRLATRRQNVCNRSKLPGNKTGFKGVFYRKGCGKWTASISSFGKRIHLGYFTSPELASRAYSEAADRLHGEFARK